MTAKGSLNTTMIATSKIFPEDELDQSNENNYNLGLESKKDHKSRTMKISFSSTNIMPEIGSEIVQIEID